MIPPPADRSDTMVNCRAGRCGRGGWKRFARTGTFRRASRRLAGQQQGVG